MSELSEQQQKWDNMLMMMAQENHGIDNLLDTFFGFLHRKTDFFSAAAAADSRQKVISAYEKWIKVNDLKEVEKKKDAKARSDYNKEIQKKLDEARKKQEEAKGIPEQTEKIMEVTDEQAEAIKQEKQAPKSDAQPETKKPKSSPKSSSTSEPATKITDIYAPSPFDEKQDGEEDDKDFDPTLLKPNFGNGANYENYSWTQTLKEAEIRIPFLDCPNKLKGRDFKVVITKTKITAGLKNKPPVIEGKLHSSVKEEDSTWVLDNNVLTITLEKIDNQMWWKNVVEGQPMINTRRVQPENSNLSDLDGDTRGMVEKMMYDQRQKQMGLPTSEEQKKQDMLKEFMKQHPEMDFSKAKIG